MEKLNLKTLLIANLIFVLIVISVAFYVVKKQPQIKPIDNLEYNKARFDSIVSESNELKRLIQENETIQLTKVKVKYAYKDSIIFLSDIRKSAELDRILAALDSEVFTY